MEVLIYEQPHHCITLDRFMQAYEKKYSRRLAHFHGHSKLLKLLEDFADTLEVRCKVIHGLCNRYSTGIHDDSVCRLGGMAQVGLFL